MKTQLGFGHFPRQGLGHHSVPLLSPLSPVNVCLLLLAFMAQPCICCCHVSVRIWVWFLVPVRRIPETKSLIGWIWHWMSISWPIRLVQLQLNVKPRTNQLCSVKKWRSQGQGRTRLFLSSCGMLVCKQVVVEQWWSDLVKKQPPDQPVDPQRSYRGYLYGSDLCFCTY